MRRVSGISERLSGIAGVAGTDPRGSTVVATEIERKYLVRDDSWRAHARDQVRYQQGYMASSAQCSVRVRIGRGEAHLNIKGATVGVSRLEFEYPLPLEDARVMLRELCAASVVEKTRYRVPHDGREWEVDVFEGDNAGLVVAEIELEDASQSVSLPPWAGEEVTEDVRYYNSSLASTPYNRWSRRRR